VSDKRVSFDGTHIRVDSSEWVVDYPILDARLVGDIVVIVYDYMAGPRHRQFCNAQAFDLAGALLWTAEHPTNATVDAYVNIVEAVPLILWNFACFRCTLDPRTGKLLNAEFTK
jgi:hypothetical protein